MDAFYFQTTESYNFDRYMNGAENPMTVEEANEIFNKFQATFDFSSGYLNDFFKAEYMKFISDAVNYAIERLMWSGMPAADKERFNEKHIYLEHKLLNDVERYLNYEKSNGMDTSWYDLICKGAPSSDVFDAKQRICDFACYLALFIALSNK